MDSPSTYKFTLHFLAQTASLKDPERYFLRELLDYFFLQPPPVLTLHQRDHAFTLPHESTKTKAMLCCTQLGVFTTQEKQQADSQSLVETHHAFMI